MACSENLNSSKIGEFRCRCDHSFFHDPERCSIVRCPRCGLIVSMYSKQSNSSNADDFESLMEATFDILTEGGFTFSGSR